MSSAVEPQVLLLGLRRSGKTSLLQVLDKHLPPNDTLFLESTSRPYPTRLSLWSATTLWDGISIQSLLSYAGKGGLVCSQIMNLFWANVSVIIWIIDAQDDYLHSLALLHSTILLAYSHNPAIHFHIFLHKMDGLSEDYRDDTQTDVEKRIEDDLSDSSSSFHFARGVNVKGIIASIDEEQEDENRGTRLDWSALEEKARLDMANCSDTQVIPQKMVTGAATSSPGMPSARQNNQQTRRRRQSSVRSSSCRGDASSAGISLETDVRLSLHQTSIFDSSMYVAFSRVLQDLVLKSPAGVLKHAIARLVDNLVDFRSPAPDAAARPPDGEAELSQSSYDAGSEQQRIRVAEHDVERPPTHSATTLVFEKLYLMHRPTRTFLCSDSSPFDKSSFDVVCDYLGFLVEMSGVFANLKHGEEPGATTTRARQYASSTIRLNSPSTTNAAGGGSAADLTTSVPGTSFMMNNSGSLGMTVGGGGPAGNVSAQTGANTAGMLAIEDETLLSFWELDEDLALVGILRHEPNPVTSAPTLLSRSSFLHGQGGTLGPSNPHRDLGSEEAPHEPQNGVLRRLALSDAGDSAASNLGSQVTPQASPGDSAEAIVDHNVSVFRTALAALKEISRGQRDVREVKNMLWSPSSTPTPVNSPSVMALS